MKKAGENSKQKMRIKVLVILSFLLILSFVGLQKLNKDFLLLWNANSLHVKTEKPLDKGKVTIRYGWSSINRKTDEELFSYFFDKERSLLLFDNGSSQNEIPNEYGENDYLITYDNEYYLSFRHWKLNRRHQHDYYFKFYMKQDSIFVKVNIEGEDQMEFERQLLKISEADKYRCNTLIDSTKALHNGVELIPLKRNK